MGSEARARIGLVALLVAALFCFELVFASGDYAGPALLGAGLAAALTIAFRRFGIGAFFTLLGSVVGLLIYLCLLFQAGDTSAGLPTATAIRGLSRALEEAMTTAAVDFAPVPVRSGYVIMIIVGMWVATTIGEIATFRWRYPLFASIGPIALAAVALVIGTGEGDVVYLAIFLIALFAYWSLESQHRLRSWGRWVGAFSKRRAAEPRSLTGGLAGRMGAVCLTATLAAPVFLPALGDGLLDWRGPGGGGSGGGGGGVSGEVNLLVDITPRLIQQSDKELFSVETDRGTYWRLASLGRFDGARWLPIEERKEGTSGTIPYIQPPPDGRELLQSYDIEELEGSSVPAAVHAVEVTGEVVTAGVESGNVELEDGELHDGMSFTVRSELPDVTYKKLIQADVGGLDDVGGERAYWETGPLSDEVEGLRRSWTRGRETPFEKLTSIQENLRLRFDYSVDIADDADNSSDYLEQFLLETKRGFCQQFATAFAILARDLGYPTRVSVGFLPGSATTLDNGRFEYTVRGTDAHAWPEVYFKDIGWVAFEPTPRADGLSNQPAYTLPPPPAGGGSFRAGESPVTDGRPNPQGGSGPGRDPRLDSRLRDPFDFDGRAGLPPVEEDASWRIAFGRTLAALILAFVTWLLLVPAIKQLRIARRYRRARSPSEKVLAAFFHFESDAAHFGTSRLPSESPSAFAARVEKARGVDSRWARRLAHITELAAYSAQGAAKNQAGEAFRLARKLRRSLWSRASIWRRIAALWSAHGLRSQRRRYGTRRLLPTALTRSS